MLWQARRGYVCGRSALDGLDLVPATITSANTDSVAENVTLAHAMTADKSVTWSLVGGSDQAKFDLSGSTLRWLANGTKNFEIPDDSNTNNTYVVTVRATTPATVTTDQTITVTVTDDTSEGAAKFDSTSIKMDSTIFTMDAS